MDSYKNTIVIKNKSNILLDYLYEYINDENYWTRSGKTQPFITLSSAKNEKIPLPPLDIQQKIVDEIEKIENENSKSKIKIETSKTKIIQIVNQINSDKKKLSTVIDIIGGGTPKTNIAEYWDGDIPWISIADFNNDERFIYKTEKTITKLGLEKSSTKLLQNGDLIISARGTVGALGQIVKPMAFNQSCYGIRPIKGLSSDYLYFALKNAISQFKNNSYGAIFETITIKTFSSIEIPVPPIAEQEKIVSQIEELEKQIVDAQKVIDNSKQQKQAILDKYLK